MFIGLSVVENVVLNVYSSLFKNVLNSSSLQFQVMIIEYMDFGLKPFFLLKDVKNRSFYTPKLVVDRN